MRLQTADAERVKTHGHVHTHAHIFMYIHTYIGISLLDTDDIELTIIFVDNYSNNHILERVHKDNVIIYIGIHATCLSKHASAADMIVITGPYTLFYILVI